eukprot:2061039-Pyramimonas_sp.AAC.1
MDNSGGFRWGLTTLLQQNDPPLLRHLPPAPPTKKGDSSVPCKLLLRGVSPVLIGGAELALYSVRIAALAGI